MILWDIHYSVIIPCRIFLCLLNIKGRLGKWLYLKKKLKHNKKITDPIKINKDIITQAKNIPVSIFFLLKNNKTHVTTQIIIKHILAYIALTIIIPTFLCYREC